MKSYKTEAPPVKEVYSRPQLLIATFFGAGCITPAPGTWGSFAAWAVFLLLEQIVSRGVIWFFVVIFFLLGLMVIPKSEPYLKKMDHGSIVIDEVVAVWLVLLLTPLTWGWQLASVVAFRFFDIVKLPPASSLDKTKQNGFTVMFDDIIAAFYALLVIDVSAFLLLKFTNLQIYWSLW